MGDPMKLLVRVAFSNAAQTSDELTELADQEEKTILNKNEERKANQNTNTGKPAEEPTESELSSGTAATGLKAHGVDRKGVINTEANTVRSALENALVSSFSRSETDSAE